MGSSIFVYYIGILTALVGGFFLTPHDSWVRTVWQVGLGWTVAGFVLVSARRQRPQGGGVWSLFAAGIFLNAAGILVERIVDSHFGAPPSPNVVDLFYLGLYPCLILGLATIVYRRSADDVVGLTTSTAVSTVMTIGMGIVAWELVIVPQAAGFQSHVLRSAVFMAYPLGDLVLLALVLRLLIGDANRGAVHALMLASVLCFLMTDLAWVVPLRTGSLLSEAARRLLEGGSLIAYALMGAAACHPDSKATTAIPRQGRRATPVVWGALAVSLLIAPAVLAVEALFDKLSGTGLGP